jgi:hypothetical protein
MPCSQVAAFSIDRVQVLDQEGRVDESVGAPIERVTGIEFGRQSNAYSLRRSIRFPTRRVQRWTYSISARMIPYGTTRSRGGRRLESVY